MQSRDDLDVYEDTDEQLHIVRSMWCWGNQYVHTDSEISYHTYYLPKRG